MQSGAGHGIRQIERHLCGSQQPAVAESDLREHDHLPTDVDRLYGPEPKGLRGDHLQTVDHRLSYRTRLLGTDRDLRLTGDDITVERQDDLRREGLGRSASDQRAQPSPRELGTRIGTPGGDEDAYRCDRRLRTQDGAPGLGNLVAKRFLRTLGDREQLDGESALRRRVYPCLSDAPQLRELALEGARTTKGRLRIRYLDQPLCSRLERLFA